MMDLVRSLEKERALFVLSMCCSFIAPRGLNHGNRNVLYRKLCFLYLEMAHSLPTTKCLLSYQLKSIIV